MYLLVYAAKTGKRPSISEWTAAARRLPAFIAGTADFDAMAQYLIDQQLAKIGDDSIILGDRLASLGHHADNITLAMIARILLEVSKPQWLMTAVCGDTVLAEYLPTHVENHLAWLAQYRDVVLRSARRTADNSDLFRHWLGKLGEEIVFRGELQSGCEAAWMSQLSDAFGYDILSTRNGIKKQLEVKTTIEETSVDSSCHGMKPM
ncbi:MAG: hypothetical protein IPG61_10265 [bacterium]|nr:hypothetical protein [bacterium]